MTINIQPYLNRLKEIGKHPINSFMSLVLWTGWVMAVLMAWVTIYRQFNVTNVMPYIKTTSAGLDLIYSFIPLALIYFINRRLP